MRYSIRMKEGWISYYNRFNASFGVECVFEREDSLLI